MQHFFIFITFYILLCVYNSLLVLFVDALWDEELRQNICLPHITVYECDILYKP